jgi:hypothetical protein
MLTMRITPRTRFLKVVWENVRVLKGSGETVSVDGTHLVSLFFRWSLA